VSHQSFILQHCNIHKSHNWFLEIDIPYATTVHAAKETMMAFRTFIKSLIKAAPPPRITFDIHELALVTNNVKTTVTSLIYVIIKQNMYDSFYLYLSTAPQNLKAQYN